MLRLEAEHFSAAEYDEAQGRPTAVVPAPDRLVWPGVRHHRRDPLHPSGAAGRVPARGGRGPGQDDRLRASCTARSARPSRSASRSTATTGSACPTSGRTPGPCINAVSTALHRRGRRSAARSSGCCLMTGLNPTVANVIQALLYTLATRLGAPGRNRYMLVMAIARRPRRRLGDGRDRRDRRRVPRPLDHPVRGLPDHRPRGPVPAARPRGGGDRARSDGRPTAGASSGRGSPHPGIGDRRRPTADDWHPTGALAAGRALRPYPVLRLGLSLLRLRRVRGSGRARAAEPRRGPPWRAPGRDRPSGRRARRAIRWAAGRGRDRRSSPSTSAAGRRR